MTGNTLLMLAAYHGHAETANALLALGADPDRTNDRGQSPLAGSIFKGEDAVVWPCWPPEPTRTSGRQAPARPARVFDRTEFLHRSPWS